MSLQIQLKKSAVTQKQPFASDLAVGELALNYHADGPFLTCKDTAGNVRKLNHVWVGASAPSSPSKGDLWLDTSLTTAVLKVYKDSLSSWVNATTVPLASTSVYGTVQLASTADINNGTAAKIVDAAQLQSKITTEITSALAANPLYLQNLNVTGTATTAALSVTTNATIGGNLTVNGTTTTIDTATLLVEDKNIELGVVATPSDLTANGGGITLKGATDKTFNWVDATDAWTSSEHLNLASGKSYFINGTQVLSATALGSGVQISSANIPSGTIIDSDISNTAEIAVSKLADGNARQLLQTDAAGTGVEWASNIDIPGTLDVTGAVVLDSSLSASGTVTFGSGLNVAGNVTVGSGGALIFEGTTDDAFETTISVTDPTADRTIVFPNISGTVVTTGDTGTVTSAMIANGTIVNEDINASAAIADSKLATISTANKVSLSSLDIDGATDIGAPLVDADLIIVDDGANGTNRKAAATRISDYVFNKVSGDITVTASGVSSIASGVIVNSEINASAAIDGTKISPNFGSQNCVTTGNSTAAAFIPTGSAAPTNGAFLPTANTYGIATNGVQRNSITADGGFTFAQEIHNSVATTTYTILASDIRNGILLHTAAAAVYAVPSGGALDSAYPNQYTNMAMRWTIINTGTGTVTVSGSTNHSVQWGNMVVATATSASFLTRRTGAGTYNTYRV